MTIILNNLQLLEFYKSIYPNDEIVCEGKVMQSKQEEIPAPILPIDVEVKEEEEIKDTKNNKKFNK